MAHFEISPLPPFRIIMQLQYNTLYDLTKSVEITYLGYELQNVLLLADKFSDCFTFSWHHIFISTSNSFKPT